MNNPTEQLDAIKDIRNMMERSSRFLSLSGLSGVFIGLIALTGVSFFCIHFHFSPLEKRYYRLIQNESGVTNTASLQLMIFTAIGVLLLAVGSGIIMSVRKSKQMMLPIWDNSSKRMLVNMLIPLVTGAVFCLILLSNHQIVLLAPASLIFYGLSLVNASKYTIEDIRYLGVIEIILGLSSAWWIDLGLINWTIGFGVLHILYGLFLHSKHEK
jgi:hypothetical protein